MKATWIVVWILVALMGVTLVFGTALLNSWGAKPSNASVVGYAGFAASVFGVYGSVLGFTLTIQQLMRTRTASEAADRTLKEIQAKLTTVSASGEVERARNALDRSEHNLGEGNAKELRISLGIARQSFVRIKELELPLFDDLENQIAASISEMSELVDSADFQNKNFTKTAPGYIRTYLDIINRMQIRMSKG